MRKILLISLLFIGSFDALAQADTYDLASYTAPRGWKKEIKQSVVVYTFVDEKDKTWCSIGVYKSIGSKGTVDDDFAAAWEELVVNNYKITEPPQGSTVTEAEGWKIKSGAGRFIQNNSNAIVLLTAFTSANRTVDVLATTNAQRYIESIENFVAGISLKKPAAQEAAAVKTIAEPPKSTTGSYSFLTTNFDDGWVSNVRENWVEVSKGAMKVLLHYPNAKTDVYNSVLRDADYNAWNLLVAPRYNNMTNFEWKTIQSWESITFIRADAIEKTTGQKVHIVLFKKHVSSGNGRYLEFVSPTLADYEKEFGAYHNTEFDWDKPANMQYRNKFAVSAADLIGTWTANDYASLRYYYVNTGGFAGATATSTATEFTFLPGNKYESDHSSADGVVGNQKFSRQVYKGQTNVSNWQISLTNRFKGATDVFSCQMEAIKGGRILILNQITEGFKSSYTLVKK